MQFGFIVFFSPAFAILPLLSLIHNLW